jgi:hypothetical protein
VARSDRFLPRARRPSSPALSAQIVTSRSRSPTTTRRARTTQRPQPRVQRRTSTRACQTLRRPHLPPRLAHLPRACRAVRWRCQVRSSTQLLQASRATWAEQSVGSRTATDRPTA